MKKRPKGWWGFEATGMDKKIRPQDDFYHYANGGWIKKAKIPADESRWGSYVTLRYETEHQLKVIMDELLKLKNTKKGSPDQLARDYFRAASDIKFRNKLGKKPIESLYKKIQSIETKEELLECVAYLHVLGVSGFWGAFVDQDSKENTKYILHLWQSGLSMPERDYYIEDKPEQKRVRDAYILHIEKLSKLFGKTSSESAHLRDVVMDIETRLAKVSMKREDTRDHEKTYHKKTLAELQALSPTISWKKYFAQTGVENAKNIIVAQPEFFAFVSKLISDTPLEDLKIYLEWHLLNGSASLLSEPFIKENFNFYGTVITGAKAMKPLWRRALGATNGALGDALGKIYVKKHFPPSSKRIMDSLVDNLFAVFAARIKRLDWMSTPTKKKALTKLRAMNRKIGYPSKWKSYRGLIVTPHDYFGNVLRSSTYEHYRNMNKLGKPIDREEWFMSPQTVNAYFAPTLNDIVFPAAFLQWPEFDPTADDALNYAAIGVTIGHEMTHGFDDQGSKFDNKGDMKNWWTPKDRNRFTSKSKVLIDQYNAYEVAPGLRVNGKLTLGENIADLGGITIAFEAYQNQLKKTGRKIIGGLTPEQRFFLAYTQVERVLIRSEFLKMQVLTDGHSPEIFRVNGPFSNFEPFYKAFNVKKGHKLYRDPKKRAQIW